MKRLLLILTGIILSSFAGFTQDFNALNFIDGYVENHGQITDQNGKTNDQVKFLFAGAYGMNVQLRTSGFSFDLYENSGSSIRMHRIDVSFIGANKSFVIRPQQRIPIQSSHYIAGSAGKCIADVNEEVIYENMYDNIDFVFKKTASGQVKYDIVLHPGAHLSDIQLHYAGSDGMSISDGQLELENSIRP